MESLTRTKTRHVLVAIVQSEAHFTGTKLDGQTTRKSRELKIEKRFERRTSNGSRRFAFLGCGFVQIFLGQTVSIRVRTLAIQFWWR